MASVIEHFEIETDASVYFPGSFINGRVCLRTNKSVLCPGVSLEAVGEAQCVMDAQPPLTRTYYYRQATLYGGVYRTEIAKWKHGELRFANKAVPDGGTLHVPISKYEKKLVLHLIGRSGDEEVVLGAARLYPLSLIDNCRSKDRVDMPLTLDGAIVTAVAQFKASWQLTDRGDCVLLPLHGYSEPSRVVTFDISSVLPKKLPELDAPIDEYYCQITVESDAVHADGQQIKIPKLDVEFPFTLKLPEELPTSLDTEDGHSIRYALTCSLKDALSTCYSVVCHFAVIQPIPSSIPVLATARKVQSTRKWWWSCMRHSPINMVTHLDRSGYSPGELVRLKVKGENSLRVPLDIRVDLVRVHHCYAADQDFTFCTEFSMLSDVRVKEKEPFLFDWALPFPVVAPTYEEIEEPEPLTWHYELAVTVEARNTVILVHQATVVAAALPTEVFSESKGDRIHHSRIEITSTPSKQTRVILGNWQDIVAGDFDGSLNLEPDSHKEAIRATNKIMRRGKTEESSFIPLYSSARAVESTAANDDAS